MNKIIIGKREIGKTTYLLNYANNKILKGQNVAILDSATEHENKSLIKKFIKDNKDYHIICVNDKKDVVSSDEEDYYNKCINSNLFKEMANNFDKTICVDLSYFLELAYVYKEVYNSDEYYHINREIYKNLCQQSATCLMALVNENYISKLNVLTDEIEFPISLLDISCYQDKNKIKFLSAVHQEDSKGTFYKSFKPAKFIPYSREDYVKNER